MARNKENTDRLKREWAAKNPEKVKSAMTKWRERNREAARAAWRKTYQENLEKYRAKKRDSESRRRSATKSGSVTAEEWETIKRRSRYRCHYCKKKKPLEMDHVIPLSKGGPHVSSNIVPACGTCNQSKGAKVENLL